MWEQKVWQDCADVIANVKSIKKSILCTPKCNLFKKDCNPNDKYVLSERALWTMNFDTSIIEIDWKMGKLWAFKEFNMANIYRHFEYLISFQIFLKCLIFSYHYYHIICVSSDIQLYT